jgi:hypothetical protein
VESDPLLQSIVGRLLKRGFLLPGVFHPLAYERNKELIESEWKVSKSEENALAMGVSVTNDYFFEGIHEVLNGSDFLVSSVSTTRLESWQKEVRALFGHQSKMIIDAATTIGQYLLPSFLCLGWVRIFLGVAWTASIRIARRAVQKPMTIESKAPQVIHGPKGFAPAQHGRTTLQPL